MNRYLQDIQEQPGELQEVLQHATRAGRAHFRRAAGAIDSADRVVITSMGSALHSCRPLYHELSLLRTDVHLIETADLLRNNPHVGRTTYVIMSRSGESGEIAQFARELRSRSAPLVAITMTPESTLAQCADIVIHDVATFDGLICTKAFSSMALIGLLVARELVGELDNAFVEQLCEHFGLLDREMTGLLPLVEGLDLPAEPRAVHFLSQGVGMTVAELGALLMQEGAWLPASAQSFGMFHHGGIELVAPGFLGFWLDLEPDERSLQLFEQIRNLGGRVVPVSPDADAYPDGLVLAGADLPAAYRIFHATIVVQLVAYHTARARGHEPGHMRHLTWLVR
jgi:fructoselysine-6-P-deglycase FrlB-like protein